MRYILIALLLLSACKTIPTEKYIDGQTTTETKTHTVRAEYDESGNVTAVTETVQTSDEYMEYTYSQETEESRPVWVQRMVALSALILVVVSALLILRYKLV